MRSIIEEITLAESEADRIRADAAASAKELIQKARKQVEEDDAAFEEREREALREALEKAEKEGTEIAGKISEQVKAEAESACKAAAERLPGAVDYIIGKVRGSV